jgi:hypothetical protein
LYPVYSNVTTQHSREGWRPVEVGVSPIDPIIGKRCLTENSVEAGEYSKNARHPLELVVTKLSGFRVAQPTVEGAPTRRQ